MSYQSEIAYRSAAANGATHIGLLMLVYDALAKDLLDAGHAINRGDVEARCEKSKHALVLLAHLESWIQLLDDPKLAASLHSFYGHLRTSVLGLQMDQNSDACERLAKRVCETRTTWQRKEQAMLSTNAVNGSSLRGTGSDKGQGATVDGPSRWSA